MNKAYIKQTFVDDSAPDINAENLNKITTALDIIDNRVIESAGNAEVAATYVGQFKNAVQIATTSANSAKADADSAKTNADLAKTYADEAFSGTPEGYRELVNNVGGISVPLSEAELKVLGWNTPSECPIKNELNGNQFVQRVGRVDGGTLDWKVENTSSGFNFYALVYSPKGSSNVLFGKFGSDYTQGIGIRNNAFISSTAKYVNVTADGYGSDATAFKSAMSGNYLYYELATPNTYNVEGSEVVESIGKVTNMLKPVLGSTTSNGVTCTYNSADGTYVLNGTASTDVVFSLERTFKYPSGTYRLVGCPAGGSLNSYCLIMSPSNGTNYLDVGNGVTRTTTVNDIIVTAIYVKSGYTCNNLVFKPMLTTNLSAQDSDFVPFTGTTGKLNSDVAEIHRTRLNEHIYENSPYSSFWSMPQGNYHLSSAVANAMIDKPSAYNGGRCTVNINQYNGDERVIIIATAKGQMFLGYCYGGSSYTWKTILA